jgi:hypothetical protein
MVATSWATGQHQEPMVSGARALVQQLKLVEALQFSSGLCAGSTACCMMAEPTCPTVNSNRTFGGNNFLNFESIRVWLLY